MNQIFFHADVNMYHSCMHCCTSFHLWDVVWLLFNLLLFFSGPSQRTLHSICQNIHLFTTCFQCSQHALLWDESDSQYRMLWRHTRERFNCGYNKQVQKKRHSKVKSISVQHHRKRMKQIIKANMKVTTV